MHHHVSRPLLSAIAAFSMLVSGAILAAPEEGKPEPKESDPKVEKGDATTRQAAKNKWRKLFNGKSLDGWEVIDYAGHGKAEVKNGAIAVDQGELLSGVRYKKGKDLPKLNYEVELEARRMMGSDFFCCLTFPYKKDHATFVLGGWGGSVVGISSIDHLDAYDNITMQVREFEDKKWYKVRLRVTDGRIQGWIDDKDHVVNVNVKGKKVGMRFGEIEDSIPFALSTFSVAAEMRKIQIRDLTKAEIEETAKMKDEDEF